MVTRLVLGCGSLGSTVVRSVDADTLTVVDPDESRVETLRGDGVDARVGDPGDPAALATDVAVDVVFVAGDDPATNRRSAAAAGEAHPDAHVVAYVGDDATRDQRTAIRSLANRVVDPGAALVEHLDAVHLDGAERVRRLRSVLRNVDGTLGIFPHDNPDPDAIASAVALARLAETFGLEAEVCYYGEISHQENRALVNRLGYDLRRLEADAIPPYGGIALVDNSVPGVNNQLPTDADVDVVVDHHPTEREVRGRYVDVRPEVGATGTLLTGYYRQFGIDPTPEVATGLLFGIHVDTRAFTREATPADFEAAASLLPHVDRDAVAQIESSSVSSDTFDTIASAIDQRVVEGTALVSCVGGISDRDTLAQAADHLLGMEGVDTTLVCGFRDGTVYLSARTRGTDIDLGATLREAFGDIGSAGGHADMAGAQIPLGLFSEVETAAEPPLATILGAVVRERFFGTVRSREPATAAADGERGGDGDCSDRGDESDAATARGGETGDCSDGAHTGDTEERGDTGSADGA
jgi:nanoRNase/pAp phosphatase (c-di-AMP/oligoRNAs hydrolase)